MKLLSLIALSLLLGGITSASAKNFATINGKVVTCEQAFAYRDGALFLGFQMLSSPDEIERDKRRAAAAADLSNQIAGLKDKWNASSTESRKKLAASVATYFLATVIKKSGEATIAESADQVTKDYAKVAIDRSVEMQKTLVDTSFGNPPSAASVAGLPFGTLALVIPQLQLGAKIYEIGVFGIESAVLVGDWYLASFDYSQQIDKLESAIRQIISRSVAVKTAEFMKVKNEIDAACR